MLVTLKATNEILVNEAGSLSCTFNKRIEVWAGAHVFYRRAVSTSLCPFQQPALGDSAVRVSAPVALRAQQAMGFPENSLEMLTRPQLCIRS